MKAFSHDEKTLVGMDKTFLFEYLLDVAYEDDPYLALGEYEYAFVSFLIGEELEGLEQWKKMTSMWCHCVRLVETQPSFFAAFLGELLSG